MMALLSRRGPLLLTLAAAVVVGCLPIHGLEFGLHEMGEEEAERAEMLSDMLDADVGTEVVSSPIPTTPCLSIRSADE